MFTYINICTHAHQSVMYKTDNDRSTLDKTKTPFPTAQTPPPRCASVPTHSSICPTPPKRPTQMQCDIVTPLFQQRKNRGEDEGRQQPTACTVLKTATQNPREKQTVAAAGRAGVGGWVVVVVARAAVPLSPIKLSAPYMQVAKR